MIAVDFDGTLYKNGQANAVMIEELRRRQMNGDCIILWTCRTGARLRDAVSFLRNHGFMPNFVNQNAPHVIQMLGADPRKIWADIYIDDKNR